MKYLEPKFSVGGPATTAGCCEACVYGRGEHADWCERLDCDESEFSIQVYPVPKAA